MDLALTIFRFGVGVGALLIGLSLLLLVISLRGLARDARVLSGDLQRLNTLLARVTSEQPAGDPLQGSTPESEPVVADGDVTEEPIVPAAAPAAAESSPHDSEGWALPPPAGHVGSVAAEEELVGWWPGGASDGPVQSADEREDERIA